MAQAPDFTARHVEGRDVALRDYAGRTTVVVLTNKDSSDQARLIARALRSRFTHDALPIISVADISGARVCRRDSTEPVAVLVGPEGGFSPAEHLMAVERGFVPTTFGPHILRTETAALVSAAVLMQLGHHGARVEP